MPRGVLRPIHQVDVFPESVTIDHISFGRIPSGNEFAIRYMCETCKEIITVTDSFCASHRPTEILNFLGDQMINHAKRHGVKDKEEEFTGFSFTKPIVDKPKRMLRPTYEEEKEEKNK